MSAPEYDPADNGQRGYDVALGELRRRLVARRRIWFWGQVAAACLVFYAGVIGGLVALSDFLR